MSHSLTHQHISIIFRESENIRHRLEAAVPQPGIQITARQLQILLAIAAGDPEAEPPTLKGLHELLGGDYAAVGTALNVLKELGLIEIRRKPTDRRLRWHILTDIARHAIYNPPADFTTSAPVPAAACR